MSAPSFASNNTSALAGKYLMVGFAGIAVTALGVLASGLNIVATAWLVGVSFWTAAAIGMLMLILIHHAFDAFWTTVIRRQFEHCVAAFKWLALLFLPLVLLGWLCPRYSAWQWMNPAHLVKMENVTVGHDVIYAKKAGFLNMRAFTAFSALFFLSWIWLSARVRKASFSQDEDGDPKWTKMNAFSSGFGIPLLGLTLTFAAFYWMKSLQYHWFSTMYGVWFFANCMRAAYSVCVLIMLWLWYRGDYKGILHQDHWHCIGKMMLTFTIFWGYIAFGQYFLTWNANVPEETFWFNQREYGDWWWIGMVLVFCHFLIPFLALLSYRYKVTLRTTFRLSVWILVTIFIDLCWNILPALEDANGHPLPFLSMNLVWAITSAIGIGGICVWAYLRSFQSTKLIPIRDPRIGECLTYHE